MPYGARDDGDDADASQALLSAEEADDAAADRRMRLAGEALRSRSTDPRCSPSPRGSSATSSASG